MEPYMLSLAEASNAIHEGSLTPIDLAESLLQRIEKLEPLIEAFVTVDREAVLTSAGDSTKAAEEGQLRSPLHGIPIGIKDIIYTEGMRTTMGSPIYANFVPKRDANVVKALKDAGAIVLGKTETTEFALHDPAPTRNPWNIKHTPGGSSSGSAASVSCGMTPMALGSQTGGSVIRPASYCGIVGFKGSYDLLSRDGVFPLSWSLDHVGFMTRTVEDAVITLKTFKRDLNKPKKLKKTPKIVLLSEYFKKNADDEVWLGFEGAVGKLCDEGAEFIELALPKSFKIVQSVHRVIMSVEAAAVHEDDFREQPNKYREYVKGFISSGQLVSATAYLRAQRIRRIIIDDLLQLLNDYDCLVCPSTTDPAPKGLEWTGKSTFNTPWSLTGLPSVTVPSNLGENGMPLGFQLIGRPYEEIELLEVAAWCEEQLDFPKKPKDPFTP